MINEELIIAGFGGQGVLSMGKILAYAGMLQELEVSWMPSYGPEMRGGTANVTVIISNERISSPILNTFDSAIILNQQSLDKFEQRIKPGGILIYDTNGITRHPSRADIDIYKVDATAEATRMGTTKVFNMIVLGGYLKISPIVKASWVEEAIKKSLPQRHHHLLPINRDAVSRGGEIIAVCQPASVLT